MIDSIGNGTEQLVRIMETVSSAIVGIDSERMVTYWNNGAERVFCRDRSAMLGHGLLDGIDPACRDELDRCLSIALRGLTARGSVACRPRDREGSERIPLTVFPVPGAAGGVGGAVLVSLDSGESTRGLAGLETLVQGIAHRFNNLNASIQGFLELVLLDPDTSASTRDRVQHALDSLHRTTEITHRLLVIGNGSPTLPESLRLDQLLRTLLLFVERDLRRRGIDLDTRIEVTHPILASPWQINVLLNALVENAADAVSGCAERRILVQSVPRAGGVVLSVSDTGCGIADSDLARIFTPFFTTKGEFAAPGSPQAGMHGVGLGLALCQRLAHEMFARIEVESIRGKGSCFRFVFPVYEADPV
jgi:PAS domain S-box-containing protein